VKRKKNEDAQIKITPHDFILNSNSHNNKSNKNDDICKKNYLFVCFSKEGKQIISL